MPNQSEKNISSGIYVLNGRVRVDQPSTGGLRTSLDSVMVAAACPAKSSSHLLDLGCGVGAAGLCVLARVPDLRLTGIDIQKELIELANHNAKVNQVEERTNWIHADALAQNFICADAPFDHVICNPPYLDKGTYTVSPDQLRATALGHQNTIYNLESWLRAAHRLLKSRGTLTLIHRADYLDDILLGLGRRFGATEIIPLWPRANQSAKRVIVRTIKDRHGPLTLHPGLVLHEGDDWALAAKEILNEMKPIE